jgi:hypothetical protein
MIGDKVQASEVESLEGREGGGSHSPRRGAVGNSSEPKRIAPPRLARLEMPETEAI